MVPSSVVEVLQRPMVAAQLDGQARRTGRETTRYAVVWHVWVEMRLVVVVKTAGSRAGSRAKPSRNERRGVSAEGRTRKRPFFAKRTAQLEKAQRPWHDSRVSITQVGLLTEMLERT